MRRNGNIADRKAERRDPFHSGKLCPPTYDSAAVGAVTFQSPHIYKKNNENDYTLFSILFYFLIEGEEDDEKRLEDPWITVRVYEMENMLICIIAYPLFYEPRAKQAAAAGPTLL